MRYPHDRRPAAEGNADLPGHSAWPSIRRQRREAHTLPGGRLCEYPPLAADKGEVASRPIGLDRHDSALIRALQQFRVRMLAHSSWSLGCV
jgi:hypothetical protein